MDKHINIEPQTQNTRLFCDKGHELIKTLGYKAFTVYALTINIQVKNQYLKCDRTFLVKIARFSCLKISFVYRTLKQCSEMGLFSEKMFDKGILAPQHQLLHSENGTSDDKENLIGDDEKKQEITPTPNNSFFLPKNNPEKGNFLMVQRERKENEKKKNKERKEPKERSIKEKEIKNSKEKPYPFYVENDLESETENPIAEEEKKASDNENIPYEKIKNLWNQICTNLPQIRSLSTERKRKIAIRVKEMGGTDKAINTITELFNKVQNTPFLIGQNNRGWKADFDFVFKNATCWVKILEGSYSYNNINAYGTRGTQSNQKLLRNDEVKQDTVNWFKDKFGYE